MYQTEHDELFAVIRKGEPVNDGEYMAHSTTLTMGRMVAYTGQKLYGRLSRNGTLRVQ